MVKAIRTKEIVLGQFMEGLNQAEGAGRHMIHHHQDSRWFPIVALLETVKKLCVTNIVDPMFTPKPKPFEKKLMVGYETPAQKLVI